MCEDLILGSVREKSTKLDPFCFEIVYANIKSFYLQVEGASEYASWTSTMRSAIENRFLAREENGDTGNDSSSFTSSEQGSEDLIQACRGSSTPSVNTSGKNRESPSLVLNTTHKAVVGKIGADNLTCADCGAPAPDWVSINIGCVLCIDCSGYHR